MSTKHTTSESRNRTEHSEPSPKGDENVITASDAATASANTGAVLIAAGMDKSRRSEHITWGGLESSLEERKKAIMEQYAKDHPHEEGVDEEVTAEEEPGSTWEALTGAIRGIISPKHKFQFSPKPTPKRKFTVSASSSTVAPNVPTIPRPTVQEIELLKLWDTHIKGARAFIRSRLTERAERDAVAARMKVAGPTDTTMSGEEYECIECPEVVPTANSVEVKSLGAKEIVENQGGEVSGSVFTAEVINATLWDHLKSLNDLSKKIQEEIRDRDAEAELAKLKECQKLPKKMDYGSV